MTDSEKLDAALRQLDRIEHDVQQLLRGTTRIEHGQVETHNAMLVMLEQMADTVDDEPELDLDGNLGSRERDDTQPL